MSDLFIIEGITETGNIVYLDLEDDDYYTRFLDSIPGATIFNDNLFRICFKEIECAAKEDRLVRYYKRYINYSLLISDID